MQRRIRDMSRRELLKLFGVSVAGSLAGAAMPRKVRAAQGSRVTPLGTARNCIVIQNSGAWSPMEGIDFKETKYTASDLNPERINSEITLSRTLFPNMDVWAPHTSIVRGMRAVALVHFPAQYHNQAGRSFNPAIVREIPAFGSIVSYELESQRRETDTFPTYMSFDVGIARCPPIGTGMLPPRFAGLDLDTSSVLQSFGAEGADDAVLAQRWETLSRMLEVSSVRNAELGAKADEYTASYDTAVGMLTDPRWREVFAVSDEDQARYGSDVDEARSNWPLGMLLTRNVLRADAGSRFLWVCNSYNGGNGHFDNHDVLYDRSVPRTSGRQPVYYSFPRFDKALAALVEDLQASPGQEPGKTLFDETLIAVITEYGRTPDMTVHGGRDHYIEAFSYMFLGGGVKPGRVIGRTDEMGAKAVDTGWRFQEQIMQDHMTSTVYSALGIDYSKVIGDTPSGRVYEYQQTAPLGGPDFIPLSAIDDLFV